MKALSWYLAFQHGLPSNICKLTVFHCEISFTQRNNITTQSLTYLSDLLNLLQSQKNLHFDQCPNEVFLKHNKTKFNQL